MSNPNDLRVLKSLILKMEISAAEELDWKMHLMVCPLNCNCVFRHARDDTEINRTLRMLDYIMEIRNRIRANTFLASDSVLNLTWPSVKYRPSYDESNANAINTEDVSVNAVQLDSMGGNAINNLSGNSNSVIMERAAPALVAQVGNNPVKRRSYPALLTYVSRRRGNKNT